MRCANRRDAASAPRSNESPAPLASLHSRLLASAYTRSFREENRKLCYGRACFLRQKFVSLKRRLSRRKGTELCLSSTSVTNICSAAIAVAVSTTWNNNSMASGVIVSYPSPAPHESRPTVFKKDRRMRHSKSDPVLMALSHNSFARYSERENCWDSIDDLALEQLRSDASDAMTLEGLKSHYNCCFTCGVSWSEEQTCLDCSECGGYALHRPCPHCNGTCDGLWSRDLDATHKMRRAQWLGECKKAPRGNTPKNQQDS